MYSYHPRIAGLKDSAHKDFKTLLQQPDHEWFRIETLMCFKYFLTWFQNTYNNLSIPAIGVSYSRRLCSSSRVVFY